MLKSWSSIPNHNFSFSSFIHPLCIDMFDGRKKFFLWNWDNLFLLHFKGITWCMQIENWSFTNIFFSVLLKLLENMMLSFRLIANVVGHFSCAVIFSFITHLFPSLEGSFVNDVYQKYYQLCSFLNAPLSPILYAGPHNWTIPYIMS